MNLLTRILLAIGGVAVVGALAFIIYNQHQISVQQAAIQTQVVAQQQLANNITRSMAEWTTKADLQKFADANSVNLQTIQDNLNKLGASVDAINVVTTTSTGQVLTNQGSTGTIKNPNAPPPDTVTCDGKQIPCPNADPYGYQANEQVYALNEKFGTLSVPFGSVTFNAAQATPWSENIPPRTYKNTITLGTDENQRIYPYNTLSVSVNGKDYPLPITTAQFQQIYPAPKFTFWNPRLYLGLDGGLDLTAMTGTAGPSINLQIMSYGKFKNQPDFSILQVGAGFDMVNKRPNFLLTPAAYNVGQHIPLMNNLYIGPAIGFDTAGHWSVLGSLTVGL